MESKPTTRCPVGAKPDCPTLEAPCLTEKSVALVPNSGLISFLVANRYKPTSPSLVNSSSISRTPRGHMTSDQKIKL